MPLSKTSSIDLASVRQLVAARAIAGVDNLAIANATPISSIAKLRQKVVSGLVVPVSFTYWLFAFMALLVLFNPAESCAEEQDSYKETYHRAVDYCRGPVPRPMALSSDRRILCFDGWVDDGMDMSLARDLEKNGLFIVRSFGGHAPTTIALSYLLRDRHASVVVYDYCVAACASYFLIASDQTYIIEGSLVAWRPFASGFADCTSLKVSRDQGPKKVQRVPCPGNRFEDIAKHKAVVSAVNRFYSERTVDPVVEPPPDSFRVRRLLKNLYDETGSYPNVAWTLNPRYHAAFKTKILYEAYPKSQQEVDAVVARLHLGRVIYDP
jgi:hypothetical protein